MEGWSYSEQDMLPEVRDWRLTQIMHAPRPAWEHLPVRYLDRMLAIDDAVKKGERNASNKRRP